MARFDEDPSRVNYSILSTGKEYERRLLERAQPIFSTLLRLLPSIYASTVEGPSYTTELKAVAVELARLELALEDVARDVSFAQTRSEFLYSIIGYFLFLNQKLPTLDFDDREFRSFMNTLITLYFQGSVPLAVQELVQLILGDKIEVKENFLLVQQGQNGLDISDQFGFQIDLNVGENQTLPSNIFNLDAALRQLLDLTRPAHTLYRLRFVFQDTYQPNKDTTGKILDAMRWHLQDYRYDDLRRYGSGVQGVDRLGYQEAVVVTNEDHSGDF